MEDYREAQRQKWLASQQAAASSSGAAPPVTTHSASGAASRAAVPAAAAPAAEEAPSLPEGAVLASAASADAEGSRTGARRVHILPIGRDPVEEGQSARRLEILAPMLRRKRDTQELMKTGLYLRCSDHVFVCVKVEPEDSVLTSDTDYFVDGTPIKRLEKIQFVALWDFESRQNRQDSSILFSEYISPYFKSLQTAAGEEKANIVCNQDIVKMFDMEFQVLETEPVCDIGIVDANTMVFVDWDITPEFDKIHIVPFQDTLPHAYTFDVFNDYIKPYLSRNKHNRFKVNDQFTYQGVQFKVVCCEPDGPARVGRNTTIYCEGVLHPSLRNLLPPELLEQLSNLPPGLQMLLLNTEAFAGGYEERLIEVQEMLSRRRGLNNDTIERVEKFRWGEGNERDASQTQCMVCLCDFDEGEEVRRLPCSHVFHAPCIDEWLRRCTDCPICKANVDRAVRQY